MGCYQPNPKKYPDMWSFTPDDTEDEMYIAFTARLSEILERAKERWPEGWTDLKITPEYIYTKCISFDLYDPGDYKNYLCITRIV